MSQQEFPCEQCGAVLKFSPGDDALHCAYCGHDTPLEVAEDAPPIEELDYRAMLESLEGESHTLEVHTVKCTSCGAESTYDPHIVADSCAFCGTAIVARAKSQKIIQPRSLIPFFIKRDEAQLGFKLWLGKLWFAPNALKHKRTSDSSLQGIYIPHWTYDTNTETWYSGQRGTHYYTTRTVNGKTQTTRHTRWRHVSGRVNNRFNDVLVRASKSLPDKQADNLEPWKFSELVPYKNEYLSGFKAESYQIDLGNGFERAKVIMASTIDQQIRGDIGGDDQRISSKTSNYHDITFKHILLPIWISSYTYSDKVYRFLVNAQTGEVQGERPYSVFKIAFAVLGVLAVIGGIYAYYASQQGG